MIYNSTKESVYHVYNDCSIGKNIEKEDLQEGTCDKILCSECQRRKKEEKLKKDERENKKEKIKQREKLKREDKGVWKKKK